MPIALRISAALVLAGPTVVAFFSGGYFDQARVVFAIATWLLVAVVALFAPRAVPAGRPARAACLGLLLLATLVLVSTTWAPLEGPAWHDAQRVAMYAGFLLAATALLRWEPAARAVEPALVGGGLVVAVYGLSDRLLPSIVHLSQSASSLGRLDQPLTYWNAEGSLLAVALVLCARLAGTPERGARLRVLALAAAPWIGLGLYLTLSRGALAAAALGFLTLAVLDRSPPQLLALGATAGAGALAALASELLPGIGAGSPSSANGAAMLVVLVVLTAVTVAFGRLTHAREAPDPGDPATRGLRTVPAVAIVASAVVVLGVAVAVSGSAGNKPKAPAATAGAERLQSLGSNRGEYWKVALRVARDHPLAGHGSGSFAVDWARERTIAEGVRDAHSLVLETAAELGVIGLLVLALTLGGVASAVPRAVRAEPLLARGAVAGLVAWLLHAQLDWLWEMPAASLNALLLAALLLALSERSAAPGPARPAA